MSALAVHTLSAVVQTTPPVTLDIQDANVTIDETHVPRVDVNLICSMPAPEVVALIDPYADVRVIVTATSAWPTGSRPTVTRQFNLGLRSREITHDDDTMRVTMASDEALLIDRALVATAPDSTAVALSASLRAIVNSVLGKAIGPGIVLQPGTVDPDFLIYTDAENMISNPSFDLNLAGVTASGCSIGQGTSTLADTDAALLRLSSPTVSDSYAVLGGTDPMGYGVDGGEWYTISATCVQEAAQSGTFSDRARRIVIIANTGGLDFVYAMSTQKINMRGRTRYDFTFNVPIGATKFEFRLYHGSTAGEVLWDDVHLYPGQTPLPYFDGDTTDTEVYSYVWDGTAKASTSSRIALIQRDPELLVWQPGITAYEFLAPLASSVNTRLYCDEMQKWHLVTPWEYENRMIQITEGVNLYNGTDDVSLDGNYFESVVIRYTWIDGDGLTQVKYDVAGEQNTRTKFVEYERPFPGTGAAQVMLNFLIGRKHVMRLVSGIDLTATPGMLVSATLPNTATQVGSISSVQWSYPTNFMAITSRELTGTTAYGWIFTPQGTAWNEIEPGISWADYQGV